MSKIALKKHLSFNLKKIVPEVAKEQATSINLQTEAKNIGILTQSKSQGIYISTHNAQKKYNPNHINKRTTEIYQDIFNNVMSKISIDWNNTKLYNVHDKKEVVNSAIKTFIRQRVLVSVIYDPSTQTYKESSKIMNFPTKITSEKVIQALKTSNKIVSEFTDVPDVSSEDAAASSILSVLAEKVLGITSKGVRGIGYFLESTELGKGSSLAEANIATIDKILERVLKILPTRIPLPSKPRHFLKPARI